MITKYAILPQSAPYNVKIEQLKPVNIDNKRYYGWKMTYLKPAKNKNGKDIMIEDKEAPVIYDNKTQKIQSNNAIAGLSRQLADQQRLIANLTIQIAKLKGGK